MVESDLIPYGAGQGLTAQAVLVLAPHPDDEVFGCGGAVAGHVRAGVPVRVVVLTDGAAGFGDAATRVQESLAAAKVLGYGEPEFWNLPDRGLHCDEALVQRVLTIILNAGVDLVYAPSPWEVHPDHRQAAVLAMTAVERAGIPVRLAFFEIGAPLRPNVLVDVTATLAIKEAAMQCFTSQLAQQDYVGKICALNKYRTYTLGPEVLAAEAFWVCHAGDLAQALPTALAMTVTPGLTAGLAGPLSPVPKVSILIRSLDRAYLSEALDSVSLQTYLSIEVIVVAVRPGHRELPARCGPFPLRLVQTNLPLSRSQAANKALQIATGDFLLLLDDDDWLMPSHVARLANVLRQQPHVFAAYTGISVVNKVGEPMGQIFDIPFDAILQNSVNLTPIHSVLFRADVRQRGCRFDESLDLYEDWDFWLQVARLAPMAHLPGVSGVYRIHESSGVHSDESAKKRFVMQVYQKWSDVWSGEETYSMMQRLRMLSEQTNRLTQTVDQLHAVQQQATQLDQLVTQQKLDIERQEVALKQQRYLHDQQVLADMQQIQQLKADQAALLASRSWRMTAPLRLLSGWLRGKRVLRYVVNRFRKLLLILH